jgi:hypothetical protein
MPRRRAINDVSIAYKPYLLEFMAFYHERVQPYPRETVFEQDILVGIKPRDIERWMCKKVYGVPDPGLDDHPIHGRSSSLEFYKKALSYFMPNKRMGWNEVTQAGNLTKSSEIIDQIKKSEKRGSLEDRKEILSQATTQTSRVQAVTRYFGERPGSDQAISGPLCKQGRVQPYR